MLERDVEKPVCAYAKSLGWRHYKWKSPGNRAVPDRLFFKAANVIAIEFKATGKKPRKSQLVVHRRLREKGLKVFVIDDIEDGKQLFDELDGSI